jgi:hypothetical protein
MSYATPVLPAARYGFRRALGDESDVSSMSTGGALGLATKSILTDPSLVGAAGLGKGPSALSPFSVINLSMLSGALSTQLEAGIESVADEVIAALPDTILSTVSNLVSDVMNVVPVIGPLFKTIFDAIEMAFGGGQQAYIGSQQEEQTCQAFTAYFKTPSSGGGLDPCTTCPSDIFYPGTPTQMLPANSYPVSVSNPPAPTANPCDPMLPWGQQFCNNFKQYKVNAFAWNTTAGEAQVAPVVNASPRSYTDLDFYKPGPNWELTYMWRSALGQALMLVTEGGNIDPYEVTPTERAAYMAWQNKNYDAVRSGFTAYLLLQGRVAEGTWWSTYGGVPPYRRAQFQAVRRGIQACAPQYAATPLDKRDAGISLWPVYMDLLLNAFDTGQLNNEFVGYCLTYQLLLGAISYGGAFEMAKNLGGFLAKQDGTSIVSPYNGILLNQNLFGSGYTYFTSDTSNAYSISICAQSMAGQISSLITNWSHTVQDPATNVGQDKLAQYAAQALAIGSGQDTGGLKYMVAVGPTMVGSPPPPVKKVHGSAALLGAATAAAAIYLFL